MTSHLREQWRRAAALYTYDVDYVENLDRLKEGVTADGTHRVTVEAETEPEANLIAAQMVGHMGVPTKTKRVAAASPDEAVRMWFEDLSMELTHAAAELVGSPAGWSAGSGDDTDKEYAAILLDAIAQAGPIGHETYSGHVGVHPRSGSQFTIPLMATGPREMAEGFGTNHGYDALGVMYVFDASTPGVSGRGAWGPNQYVISGRFRIESQEGNEVHLRYSGPLRRTGKLAAAGMPSGWRVLTGGDSNGPQWDGWIAVVDEDHKNRGYLDYAEIRAGSHTYAPPQDEVLIKYVEVEPASRNAGVATALFKRMLVETEGLIDPGMLTPDGVRWWASVKHLVPPNRRYRDASAAL
jgi:hypothetical protein